MYRETATFPRAERFGLVDQIRRSAGSISTNIAEGAGRASDRDDARFVGYSIGSVNETEDHLLLARDLGYLGTDMWGAIVADLERVRSMLSRFRGYLLQRERPGDG